MTEYTQLHAPMRIMGIQAQCDLAHVHTTLNELWARWQHDKAERLPSFTLTVYCVYQYDDAQPDQVLITIGRLVAQDLPLPAFARETTLPAQNYVRYHVPSAMPEHLFETWQTIEQNRELNRSFTTDFETYSVNDMPKIYVGVHS